MAIDTQQSASAVNGNVVHVGRARSILSDKATYTLKSTPGKFAVLIIQTVGTAWTITVYDDTTNTSGKEVVQWVTADGKGPFAYQIPCSKGITVVSGGTTAGQATLVWE